MAKILTALDGMKLKTSWNWWRWEGDKPGTGLPRYGLWDSAVRTFNSDIMGPINTVYGYFWLKYHRYGRKYMPWTKMNRMRRRIKRLEAELFNEST